MTRIRILLLEDDDHAAAAIGAVLARDGCQVHRAAAVAEVVPDLLAWADALVVDLLLPDSSPSETVDRIAEWRPRVAAVVVSGEVGPDEARRLGDLGVAVIEKPASPVEIATGARAAALRSAMLRRLRDADGHLRSALAALGGEAAA